MAWTQAELDSLTSRLLRSRQVLSAFPDALPTPCLLRLKVTGTEEVEPLPLEGCAVLGRKGEAPWAFPDDRAMSSRHFQIVVTREGLCYAEDLNSRNGLWINGRRVRLRWLVHGDQLHVGSQDFVFHDGRGPVETFEDEGESA